MPNVQLELCNMSEPHQRVKSGKLRKANNYNIDSIQQNKQYEKRIVYTGIENATQLSVNEPEDEYSTYLQTPTDLCSIQMNILRRVASGYGISYLDSIDSSFRRTWNIGAWHIGSKLSISVNLRQPNITSCWANVQKTNMNKIEQLAQYYRSQNLTKSKCIITGSEVKGQIKGRWTPYIIEKLLQDNLIQKDNVQIIGLVLGQTSLFCWIVLNTKSRYLCLLTKESIDTIVKHIPDWCKDINEATSGGSIALKINNPSIENDATQLTITETGGLQYQGRPENMDKLSEALQIAISNTINSKYLNLFLDSLEYKYINE